MLPCIDHGLKGNKAGYASCWDAGKFSMQHRKAYRLHHGLTHEQMLTVPEVRHMCHNPRCKEPTHLEAGTKVDNTRDRLSNPNNTTISNVPDCSVVAEIRCLYQEGARLCDLERRFNLPHSTVYQYAKGKRR